MKTYQYQIIRYFPDRVTGEFVNVGIVLYIPEDRFFKALVTTKYGRISHFFNGVNGNYLVKTLKHLCSEFSRLEVKLQGLSLESFSSSIEELTAKILPSDDSSLILTSAKKGIDLDGQRALEHLFNRLVTHYIEMEQPTTLTDDDVWKRYYKRYFDALGITQKLTTHEVTTKTDSFQFKKAWKNEIWHCYEALSFNLSSEDSIKSKGYRWSGIIRQLENSDERLHLNLLINDSQISHINEFVRDVLTTNSDKIEVTIVSQQNAEEFAESVQLQIQEHEAEIGNNLAA